MSPTPTRREAAAMKPLMSREPLPQVREKKPAAPARKKRKPTPPVTSPWSFDPRDRHVPCGLQDPPASPSTPIFPRPSAPEAFTGPYDGRQTNLCADRDIPDSFHDGHDASKRSRIFSEDTSTELSSSSYPNTPYTDGNDMSSVPEMYDSPESYTSSSSPAPSDQSPADFTPHVPEYTGQAQPLQMYSYDNPSAHQPPVPVVHQHYSTYPTGPTQDRHVQSFPQQHFNIPYSRAAPHGAPGYSENNGYHFTGHRY